MTITAPPPVGHTASWSHRDRAWLRLAARVATRDRDHGSFRLGAVLVRGGSVIGTGANRIRNRDVFHVVDKADWSVHAEQAALTATRGTADGATLYIVRVGRDGQWRSATPCPRCRDHLTAAGVRRVIAT